MRKYGTLLELKENHRVLGLKGMVFFISEFVRNVETNKTDLILSNPTFRGLDVGPGISSFVITKEKINELFNVMDKTFDEYSVELEELHYDQ